MRRKANKILVTGVISLVMLLALVGAALAWSDVSPSDLAHYGLSEGDLEQISQGYPDGSWKPYNAMPRRQFVKMAMEAWEIPLANPDTPSYSDVPKDDPYYQYVEGATAANLILGVGGGLFGEDTPITREQATAVIARWAATVNGYDLDTYLSSAEITSVLADFSDGNQVGPSLREEVAFALDLSILLGRVDGTLQPKASLLRIQGAALLLRSVVQAAGTGVTSTSILLGILGPTGSFSGDEEDFGFELAVQDANDKGGINGRLIEIRSYASTTAQAAKVASAQKLVEEDKVLGLYNFGGMPLALALAPYMEAQKVPYLFPHTGASGIGGLRYVFTSFPYYEDECRYMLKYLATDLGFERIGIVYADNVYGHLFRDQLHAQSDALGYEVVSEQAVASTTPATLATETQALKDADPDAVIMALYPAQAWKFLEEKGLLGWDDVQLVSSGPLTDANTLDVAGGHGEGTLGLAFYADPATSMEPGVVGYRQLMAAYHPGKEVNSYSLYGFVYGKLILAGLEAAGQNLTRESFIDAMEGLTNWWSGGIMPPVTLSSANHHAQPWGYVVRLVDGEFEAITDWVNTKE